MRNRWIISDIDGTLLNSRQQIIPSVRHRIEQFQKAGGIFTLATGRTLVSALPFIHQLNIQVPVILCNGAKIYDPVSKTFLRERYLSAASIRNVLNIYDLHGRNIGIDVLIVHNDDVYSPDLSEEVKRYMFNDRVSIKEASLSRINEKVAECDKIMFLGEPQLLDKFSVFVFNECEEWHSVRSEPGTLEILPAGTNKGEACQYLSELINTSVGKFITVGDNLNDIEMISIAGQGIAVQNAHSRLKEAADWVTLRTNDEGALIEVFDYVEQVALLLNDKAPSDEGR